MVLEKKSWQKNERTNSETDKRTVGISQDLHFVNLTRALGNIHLVRKQNFPESNISYHPIRTHTCAYLMVRNVSSSENFAFVLWMIPCLRNSKTEILFLRRKVISCRPGYFILKNLKAVWVAITLVYFCKCFSPMFSINSKTIFKYLGKSEQNQFLSMVFIQIT